MLLNVEKQALMVRAPFGVFDNFHGVNTPTLADCRLSTPLAEHGVTKRRAPSMHNTNFRVKVTAASEDIFK